MVADQSIIGACDESGYGWDEEQENFAFYWPVARSASLAASVSPFWGMPLEFDQAGQGVDFRGLVRMGVFGYDAACCAVTVGGQ